ncbi:MAG TPA: transcription elongation factor GreA [Anaerolineales bacterium]|nr:transcription elongation factor GreA [Anaerolineales bacterium]
MSNPNEDLFLTAEGAEKIKVELEELKGPRRIELAKRLRFAIQQGDLSENADYTAAKEEQGFLEGRIQELEYLLQHATIVEESNTRHDVVEVGARVTVQEEDYDPEVYHLVGAKEANPRGGKISNQSPIGAALMGRREGESVVAQTPGGPVKMKILKIE